MINLHTELIKLKVLDVNDLLASTQQIRNQLNILKDQLKQVMLGIEEFISLKDSFKGEGGRSIRSFYQECHLPFLLFFESWINDYQSYLDRLGNSLQDLEPSPSGLIRQEFLEHELKQGLTNAMRITAELTEETNEIMMNVNDIIQLPPLKEEQFKHASNRANDSARETVEKLNMFDYQQTVALDPLFNELNLMDQYIQKIANMFQGGDLSLTSYQPKTLNWKDSLEELSNLNPESEQSILNDIAEGTIEGAAKAVGDTWDGLKATYELGRNIMGPFSPLFLGNELLFNREQLLENQSEHHKFYLSLLNDPVGKVRQAMDMPKYVWSAVTSAWERDVVNGDAKSRTRFFTYGLTSFGIGILGDKGIGKTGTIAKMVGQTAKGEKALSIHTPVHTPSVAGGLSHSPVPYNVLYDPLTQIKTVTENVFGVKDTTKPLQKHHYATNKSKTYTPKIEEITKKYNLDLDDDWNKELLPHQGRHPNAYHEYVIERLRTFDRVAKGDREKFLKLYEQLKQKVRENPEMLYKDYWRKQ